MDIVDKLAKVPQDISGARAKNRFDFQGHWAITLLLKEYETSESDFVILFDYHDDVVLVKDNKAYFYQVKTSTTVTNWTEEVLAGSLKNYIVKLYRHLIDFKQDTELLCLVSNLKFVINKKLCDSAKLSAFTAVNLQKIVDVIKKEYSLSKTDPKFPTITVFETTTLALNDDNSHVLGIFSTFMQKVAPDVKPDHATVLHCLYQRIEGKNNYCGPILNGKELRSRKGVSRTDFKSIIDTVKKMQIKEDRKELGQVLLNGKLSVKEQQNTLSEFDIVCSEILRGNRHTFKMYKKAYLIINQLYNSGIHRTVGALIDDGIGEIKKSSEFVDQTHQHLYAIAFYAYLMVTREGNHEKH